MWEKLWFWGGGSLGERPGNDGSVEEKKKEKRKRRKLRIREIISMYYAIILTLWVTVYRCDVKVLIKEVMCYIYTIHKHMNIGTAIYISIIKKKRNRELLYLSSIRDLCCESVM